MADNSPCKQPEVSQISTGQAGPEVNRDLETIIKALNKVIRCVGKLSDWADQQSGGGFGGGGGGGGGGDPGKGGVGISPPPGPERPGYMNVSTGSNFTVPDFFDGIIYIDPSANIDVTMGRGTYRQQVVICHAGSAHTITLKDENGVAIAGGSLAKASSAILRPQATAAGNVAWGPGCIVLGSDGKMYLGDDLIFASGKGPVVLDTTDSHYYRLQTAASLVGVADQGTGKPVPSVPAEPP